MCGIVGYWDKRGADKSVVERMAMRIQHRGPDDAGVWLNEERDLALAHWRLSIIDLTPASHQPMISPCGQFALVYNGEIYARRSLFLARDRMGEKPLYYGCSSSSFLFGSELRSLVAHPHWKGDIDRNALTLYMRHNYVPTPWSIYQGISKLPPAHFVVVREAGQVVSETQCYWDLSQVAESGAADTKGSLEELIDELDELLRDAVVRRMAADVPLGAFLSGGFDPTTVAALMQAQSVRPVKTFIISFHEKGYNEAVHAKVVARHLGTDHTKLYVSPEEAMAVIPRLPAIWDEPFSDSSRIPTLLVSLLARRHVTVSLSGDGGDELFAAINGIPRAIRFGRLCVYCRHRYDDYWEGLCRFCLARYLKS